MSADSALISQQNSLDGIYLYSFNVLFLECSAVSQASVHVSYYGSVTAQDKAFFMPVAHFSIISHSFPSRIIKMGQCRCLQSPPKERIHFCQANCSKLRGFRWKVGGRATRSIVHGNLWILQYFR